MSTVPSAPSATTVALRKKLVDILIRKGAQVNERNKLMQSPLHLAADYAMYEIVDLLTSE